MPKPSTSDFMNQHPGAIKDYKDGKGIKVPDLQTKARRPGDFVSIAHYRKPSASSKAKKEPNNSWISKEELMHSLDKLSPETIRKLALFSKPDRKCGAEFSAAQRKELEAEGLLGNGESKFTLSRKGKFASNLAYQLMLEAIDDQRNTVNELSKKR